MLTYPVYTEESAKHHVAILASAYCSHVKLLALQSVRHVIVVESDIESACFMIALHHSPGHTIAGCYPHIIIFVFGQSADIIIAESVCIGNML